MRQNQGYQNRVDPAQQNAVGPAAGSQHQPHYDASSWVLAIGNITVKKFRHAARNQQLILESLEQAGWPAHLDDPLPHSEDVNPRDRLANTIRRLNRNQVCPVVRFRMDGTGYGLCWTLDHTAIDQALRDTYT